MRRLLPPGPPLAGLSRVNEDTASPHLHPLNQAAELKLTKLGAPAGEGDQMAVTRLALLAIQGDPRVTEDWVRGLDYWNLPKWTGVALLMLETRVTAKQMLALSPTAAGKLIADVLLQDRHIQWESGTKEQPPGI
jgi:hypothetical protein